MIRTVTTLAVVLGLAACGGGEEAPPPRAPLTTEAPAAGPAAEPPPAAKPAAAAEPPAAATPAAAAEPTPAAGREVAGQGSGLRGDPQKGSPLYGQYCASCHGATGKGDGPVGISLKPRPADHTDATYMATLSDQQVFDVIKKGGAAVGKSPLMAPWGAVITDEQIQDLVAFVRQLSGT